MLPGEFDIAHSVVSRLWTSFKTTGCVVTARGGRVRSTTPAEKTNISSISKRTGAPQLSGWQISFLQPEESRSPEKLLPDVWGGGYYAHRPVVCVPLTFQTAPYCPF
ncbi:hypothetical protein TNCV_4558051 [Trichonephila clavipes]|nr:hypothetical protein TNCV_4558051 [Trichonephila clavipes]